MCLTGFLRSFIMRQRIKSECSPNEKDPSTRTVRAMSWRVHLIYAIISLFCLVAVSVIDAADEGVSAKKKIGGGPRMSGSMPIYKPPMRGKPSIRFGGGTRGASAYLQGPIALAPEEIGLSASDSPKLFWFYGDSRGFMLEFSIIAENDTDSVINVILQPSEGGFKSVNLSAHGIRLNPGIAYDWFIAAIQNDKERSKDLVAGGKILYVPLSDEIGAELTAVGQEEAAAVYAENGYWYDALSILVELSVSSSDNKYWTAALDSFLGQAGLNGIVDKKVGK